MGVDSSWLCIYFYFSNFVEMDAFIVDFLGPSVEDLKTKRLIEGHFYIRYRDQTGYHLRFRLLQPSLRLQALLRTHVSRTAREYFAQNPLRAVNIPKRFRRPESIHFAVYEPEYERYGGCEGVRIAEPLFESSSELAVRLLRLSNGHDAKKLVMTLQTTVALASAAGLTRIQMAKYFKVLYKGWIGTADTSDPEKFFSLNESALTDCVLQTEQTVTARDRVDADVLGLRRWADDCKKTFDSLRTLLNRHSHDENFLSYGRSIFDRFRQVPNAQISSDLFVRLLGVLTSYSHMMYNRHGFLPEKERSLYGVLSLALKRIISTP